MSTSRPRVLSVITNSGWAASGRIPQSLHNGGFDVFAHAPRGHVATHSRYLQWAFTYDPPIDEATFATSVARCATEWNVDLILPADDAALWLLHRLRIALGLEAAAPHAAAVLERSLAPRERVLELERKSLLPRAAAETGVALPAQVVDPAWENAAAFASAQGYPVIVKLDYAWGGTGCRVCNNEDELRVALAWKPTVATPDQPERSRSVQRFVNGEALMAPFAAWNGRLLACVPMRKVMRLRDGNATVVEVCDDPRLVRAVERIVAWFGCTGVGDCDFILDPATNEPLLLEINPRNVPGVTLARCYGVDFCALLRHALEGTVAPPQAPAAQAGTVTVFPAEWKRDPTSPYLTQGHHDVPWDDPLVVCELVKKARERWTS